MKPTIDTSDLGSITINNKSIDFDFYINSEGNIINRSKSFSKNEDWSMQILSLEEAGKIYDPNINEMIIGCNIDEQIRLSNEAFDFFEEKKCKIKLLPLNEAIIYWNRYEGRAFGLFHLS